MAAADVERFVVSAIKTVLPKLNACLYTLKEEHTKALEAFVHKKHAFAIACFQQDPVKV